MAKKDEVVKVKVKRDGISVDKNEVRIDIDDTIRWESEDNARFEIEFDHKTPFDKKRYSFNEARQSRRHRPDCERGGTVYKYTVYEEGNRGNKLDPKVILEDPT